MLRNYLKTAFRSLLRHRIFSFINIFGLAIAMALSMAIIMLVADQMMYDRYNSKRDRIYRLNSKPFNKNGTFTNETSTAAMPLRDELLANYSGIEKAVRLRRGFGNMWIEVEFASNINIPVSGYFADPEVFDVFEYELEYGDPQTALVEPYSVVLTKKAARKLFKQENPVGESFKVGVEGPYKVTGVLKETGNKSHIAFDALASMSTVNSLAMAEKQNKGIDTDLSKKKLDDWYDFHSGWVYVLLEENKTIDDIKPHLRDIEKKHFSVLTNPEAQRKIEYSPQALMNITPGELINNPIGPVLPWFFVYFFAALAGVVMVTSCFNFTNLSIARSLTRAREIGVRKVTGAMRWQIFSQFICESIIVSLLALVLAFILLIGLKPLILELSFARILQWDLTLNYAVYVTFLAFAVSVGLLAGFFPAVVLSGFKPVTVLKSLNTLKVFSNMGLRKSLLVAQFTFSLIFIITVIVVFNQLELYMRADHGFATENRLIVSLNNASPAAIKNELARQSILESSTAVSHIPAAGFEFGDGFKKDLDDKDWTSMSYFSVDEDYLGNMNIPIISGKFFQESNGASNRHLIVLNEAAIEAFHFKSPAEAIGQVLIMKKDSSRKEIVGVVKDYNHQMLMEQIKPMALLYTPEEFRMLQVTYKGSFEEASKAVTAACAHINPEEKIEIKDFYAEMHKLYDIFFGDLVSVLGVIAFLAILISCLGLLGMATYTTESRMKEISIRKILGSSNRSLIFLLSRGFVTVLLIAVLLAVPAAYFVNMLWLEQMAYHVTVDLQTILLGVLALVVFGVVTIGSQTIRAATVNPVDNLKNE